MLSQKVSLFIPRRRQENQKYPHLTDGKEGPKRFVIAPEVIPRDYNPGIYSGFSVGVSGESFN